MAGILKHMFGAIVAVIVLVVAAPYAGTAATLDEYRAQGIIAERFDGLIEIRGGQGPAEAAALVESVNAKRLELYRTRARSQGVPVSEVGKIYALEILGKAPAGTYFRKPDGSYTRK